MAMELPGDVLVNILVRLPIKDVSSFSRVCKSWCTVVSDPYFNRYYVRNSPFTIFYKLQGRSLSLLEFAGNGDCTVAPITPITSYDDVAVIGSRDCSVFLFASRIFTKLDYVTQSVFLFNPVLGSCVKVLEDRFEQCGYFRAYKVGFVPCNNTYKLVKFSPFRYDSENAEIFTIGLDTNWRNVDEPSLFGDARDHEQLISFNGAFHWVSEKYDDRICTFDLLEEKCGVGIPKPHGVSRPWRTMGMTTGLTIVNDRLSVVDQPDDDSTTMVIWTMKEYGVAESWSRDFVLTLCDLPHERWSFFHMPVVVFPNGNILFSRISGMGNYFYNLKEKRMTRIEVKRGTSETLHEKDCSKISYIHAKGKLTVEDNNVFIL